MAAPNRWMIDPADAVLLLIDHQSGLFQLVMHPFVIGYRSRLWILEQLIADARALGGAWFGTHAEVARWVREHGR